MLNRIILGLFAKGIKVGYKLDNYIKECFDELGENFLIKLDTLDSSLVFWKENNKIKSLLGSRAIDKKADILITFKSKKAATKVMTGARSIKDSYARHDTIVYGDIFLTMPVMRVFERVEKYLLPKFITKKLFNEKTDLEASKFRFYLKMLF